MNSVYLLVPVAFMAFASLIILALLLPEFNLRRLRAARCRVEALEKENKEQAERLARSGSD